MTIIVGLVDQGMAVIGGDRHGVGGWVQRGNQPKVFRKAGALFGVSGSYRVLDLLRDVWEPEKEALLDQPQIIRGFVPSLRDLLKINGALEKVNEVERMHNDCEIMIVTGSGIFLVQSDLSVMVPAASYDATGCGWQVALGALHATDGAAPHDRVRRALQAAEDHVIGVGGGFDIISLPGVSG